MMRARRSSAGGRRGAPAPSFAQRRKAASRPHVTQTTAATFMPLRDAVRRTASTRRARRVGQARRACGSRRRWTTKLQRRLAGTIRPCAAASRPRARAQHASKAFRSRLRGRGAPCRRRAARAHVHRQPGDRVHLVRLRVNLAAVVDLGGHPVGAELDVLGLVHRGARVEREGGVGAKGRRLQRAQPPAVVAERAGRRRARRRAPPRRWRSSNPRATARGAARRSRRLRRERRRIHSPSVPSPAAQIAAASEARRRRRRRRRRPCSAPPPYVAAQRCQRHVGGAGRGVLFGQDHRPRRCGGECGRKLLPQRGCVGAYAVAPEFDLSGM